MIKRLSAASADGTQRSTGTFVEHETATASFIESGDEQQPGGGTVRLRAAEREAVDGARGQRQQRSTLVLEDAPGTESLPQPVSASPSQRPPPPTRTGPNAAPTQAASTVAAAATTPTTATTATDSPSPVRQQQQFVTPKEIAPASGPPLQQQQQQPAYNGPLVDGQGPAKPSRRPTGPHTPTNDPSDYALMQRSMLEGNFDFVCLQLVYSTTVYCN